MQLFESRIACSSITALTWKGGKTPKNLLGKKYMWKQCYYRCYRVGKVMAPFLTEIQ